VSKTEQHEAKRNEEGGKSLSTYTACTPGVAPGNDDLTREEPYPRLHGLHGLHGSLGSLTVLSSFATIANRAQTSYHFRSSRKAEDRKETVASVHRASTRKQCLTKLEPGEKQFLKRQCLQYVVLLGQDLAQLRAQGPPIVKVRNELEVTRRAG
jgi:hypothetical protein